MCGDRIQLFRRGACAFRLIAVAYVADDAVTSFPCVLEHSRAWGTRQFLGTRPAFFLMLYQLVGYVMNEDESR